MSMLADFRRRSPCPELVAFVAHPRTPRMGTATVSLGVTIVLGPWYIYMYTFLFTYNIYVCIQYARIQYVYMYMCMSRITRLADLCWGWLDGLRFKMIDQLLVGWHSSRHRRQHGGFCGWGSKSTLWSNIAMVYFDHLFVENGTFSIAMFEYLNVSRFHQFKAVQTTSCDKLQSIK